MVAAAGAAVVYGAAYPATAVALRSFSPLEIAGWSCTLAVIPGRAPLTGLARPGIAGMQPNRLDQAGVPRLPGRSRVHRDRQRRGRLPAVSRAGTGTEAMRALSIERAIAFGLVPLLVVVLGFRDRLPRYGLTLGDWRWGLALVFAGCLVMTPIVLAFARLPDVRA